MKKNLFLFNFLILFSLSAQQSDLRDYEEASEQVLQTYKENHIHQTLAFVLHKEHQYIHYHRKQMTMWQVAEQMDSFVDASDPDTQQSQIVHALQVAEAMRKNGLSEEWIVAGFIHDFGKILYTFNEPQWAVVGDTFPIGCKFSDTIVYHDFFKDNPDFFDPRLNSLYGIYKPQCGLDNVHISWGHDEYLYQVIKDTTLPEEIKYAIRYHSFYPWHNKGAYHYLMNEKDHEMLKYINLLNSYDLYTKIDEAIDIQALLPYYQELLQKYFPELLWW